MDGWHYASISEPEIVRSLLRYIGVLYVLERPSNKICGVGGCFCVYRSGDAAIFVTAAHVLAEAVKLAAIGRLKRKPIDEWTSVDRGSVRNRMFIYSGDLPFGRPPTVDSDAYVISPEVDLAAFVVNFRNGTPAKASGGISIDSDFRRPGTQIVAVGASGIAPLQVDDLTFNVDPGLQLRSGRLIGNPKKGRLVRVPVYETSIPFLPGMSGSPVFAVNSSGKLIMNAIGVVCSDFSTDAAHARPGAIGCSSVVPIAWAYGLGSLGKVEGEAARFEVLCRKGAITDRGMHRQNIKVVRVDRKFSVEIAPVNFT